MENDVFLLLLFAEYVMQLLQFKVKFARCPCKGFHLRESLNANNSIAIIKQGQGEVRNS